MSKMYTTAVFLASLVAAAALSASVARAEQTNGLIQAQPPVAAHGDCSTAKADKIAAVERRKKRVEKQIEALDQQIAEDSKRIPLMPDGSGKTKVERSLEREKLERGQYERDRELVQSELVVAQCY